MGDGVVVGVGGAPEKLIMKGRSERIIRRREVLLLLSLSGLVFESNDPLRKVVRFLFTIHSLKVTLRHMRCNVQLAYNLYGASSVS